MRHIALRVAALEDGTAFEYKAQLRLLAKPASKEGFDYDDLTKRKRLIDVLDSCANGDVAHFEDADFDLLVEIVNEARWAMYDPALLQFIDDVRRGEDGLPQLAGLAGRIGG